MSADKPDLAPDCLTAFDSACESAIQSQSGLPLEKGEIWINDVLPEGRGPRARAYCNSITNFAMQAFWLDEQVDVANDALQEVCRLFLDDPPAYYMPAHLAAPAAPPALERQGSPGQGGLAVLRHALDLPA